MSFFGKPNKTRKVSGEKLLDYLNLQSDALKDWEAQLKALEQRGIKGGLLEELQEMGPSKTGELKGLLALTDEQLTEYANIFESKNALARSRATKELEGLKADTNKAINDLIATSKVDLSNLEAEYENTLSNINTEVTTKLIELQTNFTTSQGEINTDLEVKLTELEEKYNASMETIDAKTIEEMTKLIEENNIKLEKLNKDTDTQLTSLEKAYDESGTKITKEFDKDLKQLSTISRTNATTAINEVNALRPEWEKAGSNAGQGFAKGLSDSTWYATTAARSLANAAVAAANEALDTHSPSKVFFNIGAFVSKGFAKGINQYAWEAEESSESLANSIISIVGDSLKSINELSDDYSPVITPVIDLSNASAGASKLNSLFGHSYSIGATSKKNASALSTNRLDHFDRLIESIEGKSLESRTGKESNIQFTQNNYSPKALSRLDIYRQTRNQISTLKGLIRV